ncbi:hypothetical protein SLS63_006208 [Diaporthe eres]|uniref:AB hydrolase-1 domain-containing protein n=1 Tax=Diaporthe eres TaxID=83184 RepID=A0ABR1P8U2_DIAER
MGASLYVDLANQIRSGSTSQIPQYDELLYISNSYGSVLGVYISQTYPNLFNTSVLTGYTKRILPSYYGIALQNPQPANMLFPERFPNTKFPLYLTSPNESTRTNSFFGSHEQVDFEQDLAQIWWEREDVVAAGEYMGTYVLMTKAPAYTGRVLVITGEQDQPFCGQGTPLIAVAACGDLLPETAEIFPNAEFNWKRVARTGHAINLFASARETFRTAHDFLAGARFDG